MPDKRVEAIIALGVDPEKARASVAAIDAMNKGMENADKKAKQATESLRKLAEQGAKMREVGATLAASGAAILAPFILAANEYAQRYGQMEKTSRAFISAQQQQADATARLGRVAATQLIPVMKQVTDYQNKVAEFAERHPELVKAAVVGGGALVAGGAALVAAGTAISSMAKAAELLKGLAGSGVGSATGTIAVSMLSLAAGAIIAQKGINAFGDATGDARLKAFELKDALKTAREILGSAILLLAKAFIEAKKTFGDMVDTLKLLGAKLASSFDGMLDNFATGIRIFVIRIGKFVEDLWNGIANSQIGKTLGIGEVLHKEGTLTPEQQIQAEQQGLSNRNAIRQKGLGQFAGEVAKGADERNKQYAADQENLKKFADFIASFGETGSLGHGVDSAIGNLKKQFTDLIKTFTSSGGGSVKGALTASPELVQAFIARDKAIKASDKQFAADKLAAQKEAQDTERKAQEDNQAQTEKINSDFMESELKSTSEFRDQESKATEQNKKDRLRAIEDMQDTLTDAAGRRDVAAFIQAQKAGEKQLKRMDEDASDAQKERSKDFQKQRQEARSQRDTQLRDLKTSFDKEERVRKQAATDALRALDDKHRAERTAIDRAFAEQVASLEGNYAGLKSIHDKYYDEMNQAALQFVTTQKGYLQQLYSTGLSGGSSAPRAVPSASVFTSHQATSLGSSGSGVRSFATGTPYVEKDMFALLHRGERVVNAADNARGGGGGITVKIGSINMGRIATPDDVARGKDEVIKAVAEGIRQGHQGGSG